MTRVKTKFSCSECGHVATKWIGKCPRCDSWNSFEEEVIPNKAASIQRSMANKKNFGGKEYPKKISEIKSENYIQLETGIKELDRVLGGGATKGSITLISGEPGIGKSTLLMEASKGLCKNYQNSHLLYVSGEESSAQVAQRSKRLGVNSDNFYILNETCWQDILDHLKKIKPIVLILDSIQTTVSSEIESVAGAVGQIREVTYELMNYAKLNNLTCFVVGHVTKEGLIAGPKVLEHMVDTVVHFEGDQLGQYRILRAIKNRFGNTNEIGVFEMVEEGLREVRAPSQYFLENLPRDTYGRSLTCTLEGSRTIFVEVQALVVENKFGNGRRTTQGMDNNRIALLVAVVDKYFEVPLSSNDIYLNIAGGMKLNSRDSDLSVLSSLLSSYSSKKIKEGVVLIGEVGLTGEVRSTPKIEARIKEIEQLKYKQVIISKRSAIELKKKFSIEIVGIERATELTDHIFEL